MLAVVVALAVCGIVWLVVRDGGPAVSAAGTAAGGTSGAAPGSTEQAAGPSGRPSSADAAREQAEAMDSLLTESGEARSGLGPALDRLRSCTDTSAALATVERVTEIRREQVSRVETLAVDALDGGERVRESLAEALTASRDADEKFLAWAARQDADCRPGSVDDPDYRGGLSHSTEATAAKRAFLAAWNPLAVRYGLPERAEHEI
ncbi:hypothetical protein [Planomonospora venezuelensis]|uniref:Uncharacterized protein (DUF885 family) n=1 Tax=Planomonospora venezuelensis TaxID=1999 RepID=A0A841D4W5_PLAVE|nr:hypothetical protein [Planomonospora venezuelensis]MBB5964509.1 uncharacterized protein (DUF885 family) [Planomonospora venezuelensis]GIN04244.1 hypothetical protein Pve01_59020 [Planomonospora venezuelensis]